MSQYVKRYSVLNFNGTLPEIAKHFGIRYHTLYDRLKRGMSLEEAVSVKIAISQNQRNEVYTVLGYKGTLPNIAHHFNIRYATLAQRLRNGMTLEEAVSLPVQSSNLYSVGDYFGTLPEIAEHFGVNYGTLLKRLRNGIPLEEAIQEQRIVNRYSVCGYTGTLPEIAEHFGINYDTLMHRLRQGASLEEAISSLQINKIYNIKGYSGTLPEIAEHYDIKLGTLRTRLQRGMSLEEALGVSVSTRKGEGANKQYNVNGFTGTLHEIAEHFEVKYTTLINRLRKGWSLEDAILPPMIPPTKVAKQYSVMGVKGTLKEIAKHFDIKYDTLLDRLHRGLSLEEAVLVPVQKRQPNTVYTVKGYSGTLNEIAEHFGIKYGTLNARLRRGIPLEDIISMHIKEEDL